MILPYYFWGVPPVWKPQNTTFFFPSLASTQHWRGLESSSEATASGYSTAHSPRATSFLEAADASADAKHDKVKAKRESKKDGRKGKTKTKRDMFTDPTRVKRFQFHTWETTVNFNLALLYPSQNCNAFILKKWKRSYFSKLEHRLALLCTWFIISFSLVFRNCLGNFVLAVCRILSILSSFI